LRLIHTSDWHLGRYLFKSRSRHEENERFLDFLADLIEERQADCLVVAGDVFDTTTPSNRAQAQYYDLLRRILVAGTCRHVVVVAGNHDSPTFLEAPARLLSGLGVHVVGLPDPGREVLVLRDREGRPELIVCAVPYLREADLKTAWYGEESAERDRALAEALAAHYGRAAAAAKLRRDELGVDVPIVATGHLFLAGGVVSEDDGVREIHAGSLAALDARSLPAFDYVALGHLHGPQRAGGSDLIRYSGAPLPMSFSEAGGAKSVCLVDFAPGRPPALELVPVPVFQRMARLEGDLAALKTGMRALEGTGAWLELSITSREAVQDPRGQLEAVAAELGLEVVRIRDERFRSLALAAEEDGPDLAAMTPAEVFEKLLTAHKVPEESWPELIRTHDETLAALEEEDLLAT
jgi:exonuclease SbcD